MPQVRGTEGVLLEGRVPEASDLARCFPFRRRKSRESCPFREDGCGRNPAGSTVSDPESRDCCGEQSLHEGVRLTRSPVCAGSARSRTKRPHVDRFVLRTIDIGARWQRCGTGRLSRTHSPSSRENAGLAYEIIWRTRGAVKRFSGTVTSHDIVQSLIDVERSPRFDDLRYVINDFLDVDELDATGLDIDELAAIDRGAFATNPNIRIAVVTISAEIVRLALEYAQSPVNVYSTRIFSTLPDAEEWLGSAERLK